MGRSPVHRRVVRSHNGPDSSALQVDPTNRTGLRMVEVKAIVGGPRAAFRTRKFCQLRRSSVLIIASGAGARDMDGPGQSSIDAQRTIACAQDGYNVPPTGSIHRRSGDWRFIRRRSLLSIPQPSLDSTGRQVDPPHAMICNVANQQSAIRV